VPPCMASLGDAVRGPTFVVFENDFGLLADILDKVCQGLGSP